MAGITLRDYIREIEKQIDGKRYDEATAHCHYILQSYPKAVEIYRLLGKAFLENQRYGDAADIFQRVLSALPDDFVSHAGMSIIREDEGNLDEAIWHMERAFDIQPANSALQEELRRMYGRRDNVEPPKIRLTRSALARMYFKGELYPQAIAETRAALAESPDRLDLQALLTEIYAGAGQKADAVETAAKLIRKLPYCIVANRVLYETLHDSERDAEARTHLERLNQVEPYFAFISETYPTLESVPDSSIRLDKLEWKVGQTAAGKSGQPSWAASLGVSLDEMSSGGENQIPDWLGSQGGEESATAFSLEPDSSIDLGFDWNEAAPEIPTAGLDEPAEPESGEAIPDWLKDLGWTPASPESREAEAGFRFEEDMGAEAVENQLNAADLSSADLGIGDLAAGAASTSLEAADMPDWLRELAPGRGDDETQADENLSPWLDKLFTQAGGEQGGPAAASEAPVPSEDEGLPDWMTAGIASGALKPDFGVSAEQNLGETSENTEPASEMPDWLREVEGNANVFSSSSVSQEAGDIDWSRVGASSFDRPGDQPGEEPGDLAPEEAEELPSWLFGDSSETAGSEIQPTGQAETPDATQLPSWLFDEGEQALTETPAAPAAGGGEVLPSWLFEDESKAPEPAAEAEHEPAVQPIGEDELPAWLLGEAPSAETTEPTVQPADEEQLPAWLLDDEPAAEPIEPIAQPIGEDELPAWLLGEAPATEPVESTAQPAEEEELPAWLLGEEQPATESAGEHPQPEMVETTGDEALPDWLAGMAVEETTRQSTASDDEGMTEWLSAEPQPAAEETPIDEIPEWLKTGQLAAAAGDAADWLAVETPRVETEPSAPVGPTSDIELARDIQPTRTPDLAEAFAWLALMMTPIEPEAQAEPEPPIDLAPDTHEAGTAPLETAPFKTVPPEAAIAEVATDETEISTLEEIKPEAAEAEVTEAEAAEAPAAEVRPEASADVFSPPEQAADPFSFSMDGDDAFAWLESLAVKQGAQEALLLTAEERVEKPPEWVQQAAEQAASEPEPEAQAVQPEIEEAQPFTAEAGEPPAEPPTEAPEDIVSDEGMETGENVAEPEETITTRISGEVAQLPAVEEEALPAEEEIWAPNEELEEPASSPTETQIDAFGDKATAPLPRVNWMGSTETDASLDDAQSAPTEKLVSTPATVETESTPATPGEDAPPLPDWLAGVESDAPHDITEWRLPTFTRRRYDLNQASLVELERLPGIGFIMAQRIVDYRDTNGPFQRVEDLLQVPEFSRYTLEIIRENLFVVPPAEPVESAPPVNVRPSTRRPSKKTSEPISERPAEAPPAPERHSRRPPAARPSAPAPAPVLAPTDIEAPEVVREARRLAVQGEWEAAQAAYNHLLQSGQHLEWVIMDLDATTHTRPEDIDLWQTLGDAYLRANRLKEAMHAYSHAEKLLR